MPTLQDVQTWKGQTLYGSDNDKIGEIADVYLDRQSGEPEWLAVKTGLFGIERLVRADREAQRREDASPSRTRSRS